MVIQNQLLRGPHKLFRVANKLVITLIFRATCKYFTWDKVFQNGPIKTCGRQPSKKLKGSKADHILSKFLSAIFHKFYFAHS